MFDQSYFGQGYKLGYENPTLSKKEVKTILDEKFGHARNQGRIVSDFFSGFNSGVEKKFKEDSNICKIGKKIFRSTHEAEKYIKKIKEEISNLYEKVKEITEIGTKTSFDSILNAVEHTEIQKSKAAHLLELAKERPIGWWVILCEDGEITKWGKDGGTELPFTDQQQMLEQCSYVSPVNDGEVYILSIFSNGRIKHDLYQK